MTREQLVDAMQELLMEAGLHDRPYGVKELGGVQVDRKEDRLVLRLPDGDSVEVTFGELVPWQRCEATTRSQTTLGPIEWPCEDEGTELVLGEGGGWLCPLHAARRTA